MNIIAKRHCKRKYLKKRVPKKIINQILINAGNAGSSKNSQPWQVEILSGETKEKLIEKMCSKFDKNNFEEEDYQYMTNPTPEIFKKRARDCGYSLYKLKGIDRNDFKKRTAHYRENFSFFNAPLAFIFHLHQHAERGNFLDMGLFMQNIMLGLVEKDLGSCPQYSICAYSKTIKEHLGISKERIIVCGMSVGYPDNSNPINHFIPNRIELNKFVKWHD